VTDLVAQANAALARADASRWTPDVAPRLPDPTLPAPVLPRHWGRWHGLMPELERTAPVTEDLAGLVPGQRGRTRVAS
jgi:hypothetical protein